MSGFQRRVVAIGGAKKRQHFRRQNSAAFWERKNGFILGAEKRPRFRGRKTAALLGSKLKNGRVSEIEIWF